MDFTTALNNEALRVPFNPKNVPMIRPPVNVPSVLQPNVMREGFSTMGGKPFTPLKQRLFSGTGNALGKLGSVARASTPLAVVGSALTPLATATAEQAQESGQGIPTQLATSTRPTESWDAPTSTGAISFSNPMTGEPVKKTFTPFIPRTPGKAKITQPTPLIEKAGLVQPPAFPTTAFPMPPANSGEATAPKQAFDPTLFNYIKGIHGSTTEGANAKFNANNDMLTQALNARTRNMPNGSSNPLGAIAGARQAEALLGGIVGNNESQAGMNVSSMAHAMPPMINAYKEGDELRKEEVKSGLKVSEKIKETLTNPMFATEKELKEADAALKRAQTKSKPLEDLMSVQEHQDKIKGERFKNALDAIVKLPPPEDKDVSPMAEFYRDMVATLNYKGK